MHRDERIICSPLLLGLLAAIVANLEIFWIQKCVYTDYLIYIFLDYIKQFAFLLGIGNLEMDNTLK